MNLEPYLDVVRQGVTNAAALADESTQEVAHRLGTALDASARLALIQMLADAAGSISADLAPASVELRMIGAEPSLVVSQPAASEQPTQLLTQEPGHDDEPDADEESVARISLRLPTSVKVRVDELADRDGISTNSWLVRAVVDALSERRRGDGAPGPRLPGPPSGGIQGWVR